MEPRAPAFESGGRVSERVIDDCWNRIGVRGDGSCPELERHVHCHNCPVHAAAARALLDQEPPPEAAAAWTAHFSEVAKVEPGGAVSLFVFRIGGEWLALPTGVVTEVAPLRRVHSLPHRRAGTVLGVVNVHGELLVCVALASALGLDVARNPRRDTTVVVQQRLVMIRLGDVRAACPVDEVSGVHRVPPGELAETPGSVAGGHSCATKVWQWKDRCVGLLDDELVARAVTRSLG